MLKILRLKAGFTLVELMIALLLGSLLLVMVIGLYVKNVSESGDALKKSRLRTDLQSLVGLMENDIRRAGFGGKEFMVGFGQLQVFESINSTTQKCIIYAYNYDDASHVASHHFMGFRYSHSNKSIQFGKRVNPSVNECFSSGYWVNLTDPDFLQIINLDIVENTTFNGRTIFRRIDIKIVAQLKVDDDYAYEVNSRVQARNPEFNPLY